VRSGSLGSISDSSACVWGASAGRVRVESVEVVVIVSVTMLTECVVMLGVSVWVSNGKSELAS
jgi:hypothetical protein